jgi:RNA polymerase sigma-70 factor (ECF subfamily)
VTVVDLPGFEACFVQHVGRLVAIGVATSGDAELARDLAQETFVRLHRQWDQLDDRHDLGRWLTTVMSNLLIDHHRSKASERRAVERLTAAASTVAVPTEPQLGTLAALLAPLPARQRVIVALHYGDDRSVTEIADLLDVSVNTVKSALSKAREVLRTQGGIDGH